MKSGARKIKVLVALSGGVDSSVTAALLIASKKYEVVGAYMVNFDDSDDNSLQAIARRATACWLPDYRDALRVAAHLEIPLLKFDFTTEYKKLVLDYMFKEYEAGRTPNPDVLCNTFIKFGSWLNKARELGFDYLATGHYASLKKDTHGLHLMCAKDTNKDQTYFLHQLNQEQLAHTMFPLGEYTKPEVRRLALKFGLPTAKKEESMGICFVGEVPMKQFLESHIKSKPGKIILASGEIVGKHDGLPFYTIGQRHLGVIARREATKQSPGGRPGLQPRDDTKPLFVVDKRVKTNELVVGYENDPLLYKKEVTLAELHWVATPKAGKTGRPPEFPLQCEVRLRHRQKLQKAVVNLQSSIFSLSFATSQRAVTPGQFAVFYRKGECLGGGVVM